MTTQVRLRWSRRAFLAAVSTVALGGAIGGVASAAEGGVIAGGTRFATPFHWVEGAATGPTLMIVAGVHGNEGAPPIAAAALLGTRLTRGRLLVIPEANRPALAARSRFVPRSPHADLNRCFPTAERPEPRGELATALWQKTRSVRPDWVLDLHEGWGFSAVSQSMGSSVVLAPDPRVESSAQPMAAAQLRASSWPMAAARPMATRVLAAVNASVTVASRRFTLIEPGPAGSYARAVVEQLGTPALVFETTWTQPRALRVAQQLLMVRSVLEALDMVALG